MPRRARATLVVERLLCAGLLACVVLGVAAASPAAGANRAPVVAAAASLRFALEEIAAAFHLETGDDVRLSLGSSGNLARQIRQGAPYQLFLSADEQFVLELERDGFTEGEGALYSVGRLALFVPHGSPLKPDGSLEDLRAALEDGRLNRFAIANPEHAPYGQRAEEALRSAGLWDYRRIAGAISESLSAGCLRPDSGKRTPAASPAHGVGPRRRSRGGTLLPIFEASRRAPDFRSLRFFSSGRVRLAALARWTGPHCYCRFSSVRSPCSF